jgi:hypothetical protein
MSRLAWFLKVQKKGAWGKSLAVYFAEGVAVGGGEPAAKNTIAITITSKYSKNPFVW